MRVTLNPIAVYNVIKRLGKTYITVSEVSSLLGVSTYSAGKILAHLARQGLLVRWSRRTYKVLAVTGDAETGHG